MFPPYCPQEKPYKKHNDKFAVETERLIQDQMISQSDLTHLQAQIETDSREHDIIKDDLHWFVLF